MSEPARQMSNLQAEFLRLRPHLQGYVARRVGCQSKAEDLVSDVFIRISQVAENVAAGEESRRYIYRVAANIAIDHVKLSRRRVAIMDENRLHFEAGQVTSVGAEQELIDREALGIVAEALDELPDQAREIVRLSRFENLTHREIAERMGISKSLIEKVIIRSMRHCRDRLRDAGELPEPGAEPAPKRRLRWSLSSKR